MNKEESFKYEICRYCNCAYNDQLICKCHRRLTRLDIDNLEKLLAEKDKQLEEAREMLEDFQKQTVPNVDWIYEMDATINEWLEQFKESK